MGAPAGLAGLEDAPVLHEQVVTVAQVPATVESVLNAPAAGS